MDYEKIIKMAIKEHQGEIMNPGTVVAHPSDNMTYILIGYEGDVAILRYNGITKRFPASEIFDCNKVKNTAVKIEMTGFLRPNYDN